MKPGKACGKVFVDGWWCVLPNHHDGECSRFAVFDFKPATPQRVSEQATG